jgi:hypothetical protein
MLASDVKRYMHEILRPGGRSLIAFFLLNEEWSALGTEATGSIKFEHEMQGAPTANVENPDAAIVHPEAFIRDRYGECGLEVREPFPLRDLVRPDERYELAGHRDRAVKAVSRNRLAQGVDMTDIQRPKGSTEHPLIALSDENTAVAEDMGAYPATALGLAHPVHGVCAHSAGSPIFHTRCT